jgi:cytochrome c553
MKFYSLIVIIALSASSTVFAAGVRGNAAAGKVLAEQGRDAGKNQTAVVNCASCHGAAGAKPVVTKDTPADQHPPLLAGQHADYLVHSLKQYRSGKRKHAIMQSNAEKLTDKDINDLAVYYSQQKAAVSNIGTGKIRKK